MKKNKYTIVVFLGLLIVLLLLLLFTFKEGLEMTQCFFYRYLGPPNKNPKDNVELKNDKDFIDKFSNKYNTAQADIGAKSILNPDTYKILTSTASSDELQEYINTGRFPLSGFVRNFLVERKELKFPGNLTRDSVDIALSNRQIFEYIILPTNDGTITQQVRDIFSGKIPECDADSKTSSASSSLSSEDEKNLKTICKNIMK